jgi:hypothetical protein
MEKETNNVSLVFKELDKTIQIIGADKLIEILKYSRKNPPTLNEEQIEQALKLVQLVCNEFNISLDDIFDMKRKNNRRISIGVCAFVIQKELKLDNSNISYILKKSDTLISLYKQEILRLNSKHPSDRQILEKIDKINANINKLFNND